MGTVRTHPRISLNKLGEYLVAPPARRRRIIYDQKFPQSFITARYTDAQQVIAEYLSQTKRNMSFIPKAAERLLSITPRSEWEEHNNSLCAEALDHFVELEDALPLGDIECEATDPKQPAACVIGSVEISVRPEITLVVKGGKRDGQLGAIKLAFSKTNEISGEVASHIASVLHHYTVSTCPAGSTVARERCLLVDVFGEKVIEAPASFKRRMKDVEAACAEIDALWPKIS